MATDQCEDGSIPHVIPACGTGSGSAAWDDAATICPWQIYLTYGNPAILRQQFDCMKKYVGSITAATKDEYLWTGGNHYEDWLGLDAPVGSYKGSSRADFIASAFYAHSTALVVKAGKVLGEDVSEYEALYDNIVKTFRRTFPDYRTQTEMVLAVHFDLAEDKQKTADQLAAKVIADGKRLQTGFVGTPYLLHVLSGYGHTDLAYTLLLRTEYPSWLYPVTKGATTVWEHWDGIMENGDFWSTGHELLQPLRLRRGGRLDLRGGCGNQTGGARIREGAHRAEAGREAGMAGGFSGNQTRPGPFRLEPYRRERTEKGTL